MINPAIKLTIKSRYLPNQPKHCWVCVTEDYDWVWCQLLRVSFSINVEKLGPMHRFNDKMLWFINVTVPIVSPSSLFDGSFNSIFLLVNSACNIKHPRVANGPQPSSCNFWQSPVSLFTKASMELHIWLHNQTAKARHVTNCNCYPGHGPMATQECFTLVHATMVVGGEGFTTIRGATKINSAPCTAVSRHVG